MWHFHLFIDKFCLPNTISDSVSDKDLYAIGVNSFRNIINFVGHNAVTISAELLEVSVLPYRLFLLLLGEMDKSMHLTKICPVYLKITDNLYAESCR